MSDDVRTVAVLGTGIMGAAMARNVAAAGIEVRVWNRTRERAEAVAGERIAVADSAAEAARGADGLITMLSDGNAVLAAATGADGALAGAAEGAVWLQTSTVGVGSTEELAALATDAGVAYVDAPVLGTKQPAAQGELIVLASGPDEALRRAQPVFEAIASRTVELGEAGAGTRMKLVVNSWLLALTTALAETLHLAEALGVEGERFLEVISGSPIDAGYAQLKGKAMLGRSYEAAFPLRLARKDSDLVHEAATRQGLELAITAAVRDRFAAAEAAGHADADMAAVREGI